MKLKTDEEKRVELWEVARKLGYARKDVEGMLDKASLGAVLQRLKSRHAGHSRRIEREHAEIWTSRHVKARRDIYEQELILHDARRRHGRIQKPLWERVFDILADASLAQENTRGTDYEPRVTSGERTPAMPTLAETPLAVQLRDLLEAVVERAELELDAALNPTPEKGWPDRNKEIIARRGSASLVALRFGVSEAHVRKLRSGNGLRAGDGEPRLDKAS